MKKPSIKAIEYEGEGGTWVKFVDEKGVAQIELTKGLLIAFKKYLNEIRATCKR